MRHTTPISKWIRSILLDIVLVGGFGYCLYNGYELAQSVYAFFMWWLVLLGLFCMGMIMFIGATKDIDLPEDQSKRVQILHDKFWTDKQVDNFAVSRAYLTYHVITDLTTIALLVASGRWVLGSAYTLTLIASLTIYAYGRQLKEQRLKPAIMV